MDVRRQDLLQGLFVRDPEEKQNGGKRGETNTRHFTEIRELQAIADTQQRSGYGCFGSLDFLKPTLSKKGNMAVCVDMSVWA